MPRFSSLRRFLATRTWTVLRTIIGLGLGLGALDAVDDQRGELTDAAKVLGHLHVVWLLVAILLELISYVAFGQLQRLLLEAGSVEMGLGYASTLSLGAGAIGNSLPAGPAFASLYAFRLYRRAGADETLAGWALVASVVCVTLMLGIVATVGVFLAFSESSSYGLVGIIFGVLVISVLADAIVLQRQWFIRVVIALLLASRRVFGRPRRHGAEIVEATLARLGVVRVTWVELLGALASALGVWAFDCGALAFSFPTVGAGIPWRGLLLTYGAAQLAVNLPITPGGLGVVEGTITIALVAFGGSEGPIVAAVLCYRIVSFWGFLPVGWAAWLGLKVHDRRDDRERLHRPHDDLMTAEPEAPR